MQAEYDAARQHCMGTGCDAPGEGASSHIHMLVAVQALTKVATALADGVQLPP